MDQAYGAALEFLDGLGVLALTARAYEHDPGRPDRWQKLGATYAAAFIAWFDLTGMLTPAARDVARQAYGPESPQIRLGKARPSHTVIEAIADELGPPFRNALYAGRRHPLEPDVGRVAQEARAIASEKQARKGKPREPMGWGADFKRLMKKETRAAVRARLGIKSLGDGWLLMSKEWKSQSPESAEAAMRMLRYMSIDFDEVRVRLDREARAVLMAKKTRKTRTKRKTKKTASDESSQGDTPRPDGVLPPRTIIYGGVEYDCELTPREVDFLSAALTNRETDIGLLMHSETGAVWKEVYSKEKRNRISQLLTALNTKLLAANPPLRLQFGLRRGMPFVFRDDPTSQRASQ